jgi:TolB-like protein
MASLAILSVQLPASPLKKRQRQSKNELILQASARHVSEIVKHDVYNTYADSGRKSEELCGLPFQNMSGDPEQDYFTDGVVDDIIIALSRFRYWFVIARSSSFTYKGPSGRYQTDRARTWRSLCVRRGRP